MITFFLRVVAFSIILQTAHCLRCFKCNQRLINVTVCKNSTTEDCTTVFPQTESICLKTVQRFSTGQPPWVFGQCQIRAAFQADQLGSCRLASAQGGPNGNDSLETCTCLTDLCNDSLVLNPFNSIIYFLLLVLFCMCMLK